MKKALLCLMFSLFMLTPLFATTHTIVSGDTLWAIAGTYYGVNTLWPAISDLNRLPNPNSVAIGTVLTIPSKTDAEAICNETDETKKAELIARLRGESTDTTTETGTDTGMDSSSSNNNGEKVKFVAPTSEDTNFDTYLNADVDESAIVGVSDSAIDGGTK